MFFLCFAFLYPVECRKCSKYKCDKCKRRVFHFLVLLFSLAVRRFGTLKCPKTYFNVEKIQLLSIFDLCTYLFASYFLLLLQRRCPSPIRRKKTNFFFVPFQLNTKWMPKLEIIYGGASIFFPLPYQHENVSVSNKNSLLLLQSTCCCSVHPLGRLGRRTIFGEWWLRWQISQKRQHQIQNIRLFAKRECALQHEMTANTYASNEVEKTFQPQ